jgi:thiol-disulfide isomerase/thioredoxin
VSRRGRVPALLLAGVLAVLGSGALAGCSAVQGTDGLEYVAGDGRVQSFDPDERDAPVESSGTTLDGTPLDVASYRGQVLVVNVWASWCGPCRTEMPMLADVDAALPDGAAMMGVTIRDSTDNAQALVRTSGISFPSLEDRGGGSLLDFSSQLGGPESIPSTMVLDRQGRLARLILGPVPSERTLLDVVDDVMAEPETSAAGSTVR